MNWEPIVSISISVGAAIGALYTYFVHTQKLNEQLTLLNKYQIDKNKEEEENKKRH